MRAIMLCFLAAALFAMGLGLGGGSLDDREMRALTRRVAALEKEGKAAKKSLDDEKRRSNARDMLLAKWLDEYHPRGGNSQYHQSRIRAMTR